MHFPQVAAYKDNSFWPPEDPRDFEKILDSPTLNEVWADMETVLMSGKVKAIGELKFTKVSEFVCRVLIMASRC